MLGLSVAQSRLATATLHANKEAPGVPAPTSRAFAAHSATVGELDLLQELTIDCHLRVRSNRDRRCDLWTDRQGYCERKTTADSDFAKHLVLHRSVRLGSVSSDA